MERRTLAAAGLAATASLGLFLASLQLGPGGAALGLFTPLGPAWATLRYGLPAGGFALLAAAVGVGLVTGSAGPVFYLILQVVPALLLSLMLRRRWDWDRALVAALAVMLLLGGGGLAVHALRSDQTVPALIEQSLRAEVEAVLQADPQTLSAEQRQEVTQVGEQLVQLGRRCWPGLGVFSCLSLLLLNLWALSRLRPAGMTWAGSRFTAWKAPERLVWLLISGGFLAVLPQWWSRTVGINLLLVMLPVYFLQGLAVVTHLLQRRHVTPLLRALAYGFIFLVNPMPLLVTGVGLFDLWFDFRKPRIKTTD